jgi:hypothetical protein
MPGRLHRRSACSEDILWIGLPPVNAATIPGLTLLDSRPTY